MKKQSNISVGSSDQNVPWKYGGGLQRGTLLLRRLRSALEGNLGHSLTYKEWSEIVGEPKSTLASWVKGGAQPSPEALLRMFEMLPNALRHQILDDPCFVRCRPVVEHPRVSHDSIKVSVLKTVVAKTDGITWVQADRDDLVTFMVTAFGHSSQTGSSRRRQVMGLDSHAPEWFVPVPGVTYLDNVLRLQELHDEFEKARPRFENAKGANFIFNGGWSRLAGFAETVRALAQHSHVLVGDKVRPRAAVPYLTTHIITLSADRTMPERIRVDIQAL